MKSIAAVIKASLLVMSLAIVGSAALGERTYARESWCEEEAHTCHVIHEGQTYHLKEVI